MSSRHATLAAAAAVLFSTLGAPAAARAERFRYRFRTGQVTRSQANLAGASLMGAGGAAMKMQFRVSMLQTQRVRAVSGGTATLELLEVPISGHMTALGRREPYEKTRTRSIIRLTERGRILSRKEVGGDGSGGAAGLDGADVLYGLNFPDRDVKPGDTWEDTLSVGAGATARKVRMTSRFAGWETVRGRRCARIQTSISLPGPAGGGEAAESAGLATPAQGSLTGTITTYFDPKAGVEVYSKGSLITQARTDLSGISPEAGELASIMKINFVQGLLPAKK